MENKTVKDPQIYISKELRQVTEEMRHYDSFFKQLDNKDMFILAVLFGYLNKNKKPLKKQERTESGYTRERYLLDRDNAILKAVAVAEKDDVKLINSISDVYSIAEEYANGGTEFLRDFFLENPASLTKKFADKLKKYLK